jgi:hypothetical protein
LLRPLFFFGASVPTINRRDGWWTELRREVSLQTSELGYTALVGYVETTTICNNLCLLSATGSVARTQCSVCSVAGLLLRWLANG